MTVLSLFSGIGGLDRNRDESTKAEYGQKPGWKGAGQSDLGEPATQWPTTNACDTKGAVSPEACKEWENRGTNLPEMAVGRFPQAPETWAHGQTSLNRILAVLQRYPGKRRLNWKFVQALMGFPGEWL